MNIHSYIGRIGFEGKTQVDENCLKELHKAHVMSVPFESIDVHFRKRIELNLNQIYNKVILNHRGGYCYELNFLFHALLSKIGFETFMISARIFDNGQFGPEFDHMAIVVKLKELWLVDVGYGDLFIEPKLIKSGKEQEDKFKTYKIEEQNSNEYTLLEYHKGNDEFRLKYKFKNIPRRIDEFIQQNEWKQSSKESYFVINRICTLPTENGRKTILNSHYKIRINEKTEQIELGNKEKFLEILKDEFKIEINYPT